MRGCLRFQPTDRLFSHKLCVFPLEPFSAFATLQSRVHGFWAWLLSSTLETRLNYSPSDCFDTFPFPQPAPRTVLPSLESIGERLYGVRASYMIDANQGLTKTYNALKDPTCDDPRILELRRLHEELDRAVLDAYGWTDMAVPPFCPMSDADCAAVQAFEDEVIDRLYVLNAERHREEQRLGLAAKRGRANADEEAAPAVSSKKRAAGKKKPPADDQGKLF